MKCSTFSIDTENILIFFIPYFDEFYINIFSTKKNYCFAFNKISTFLKCVVSSQIAVHDFCLKKMLSTVEIILTIEIKKHADSMIK